MDAPIGRNRAGGEHNGDVRAAEKQRIMASAALSPGAPSSFLVRALCSEGEGRSGAPLARLETGVPVCRGRGGRAAEGYLRAPREFCGIGGGTPLVARQIGREGVEEEEKPYGQRRGSVGGARRPRDHAWARRDATARTSSLKACHQISCCPAKCRRE